MRFGVIVEGPYDEAVIQEFLIKCHGVNCESEVRVCGTRGGVMRKFRGHLEEFRYRGDIEKAIVLRDANRKDPSQLRAQMEAMIANRAYPFPVKFAIVVKELEAWLLADDEAISGVTGKPTARQPDPIEAIESPKERLKDILSKAGISYTIEQARKIAVAADIQRVANRCPAFRAFCRDAADC